MHLFRGIAIIGLVLPAALAANIRNLVPTNGSWMKNDNGHRILQNQLIMMGDEGEPEGAFPLGECQGDCDSDTDCQWGLNCFKRSGFTPVPGCAGDGEDGKDYCYVPANGELVQMGDNEEPADAFPLQECQGDCDNDAECDGDLECFQRDGTEPVPGCTGKGQSRRDYCYRPPSELTDVDNNGDPASPYSLQYCQGHCNSDEECQFGLSCFKRDGTEVVPGCTGDGVSGNDYCYRPPQDVLVVMGDENVPQSVFPLKACQGDCDNDDDCDGDLQCFARDGNGPVPGCTGEGIFAADYCYDSGGTSVEPVECDGDCDKCQGNCKLDAECKWGLNCYKEGGMPPGCTGTPANDVNYCYKPAKGELVLMGDEDKPKSAFPLKECQGDCDRDSDCEGDLECFKRKDFTPVPGCNGVGDEGEDYCYNPLAEFPTASPSASFAPTSSASPTWEGGGEITFYVTGDTPYNSEQEDLLEAEVEGLPLDAEFLVHVGDIKSGGSDCTEDIFKDVSNILQKSHAPVFIIPGDNEWNDCDDPDEAWGFYEQELLNFDTRYWNHNFNVTRQSQHPENFVFEYRNALFFGLNLVGGSIHNETEWENRMTNQVNWFMEHTEVYVAGLNGKPGRIVIFGHANPKDIHDEFFFHPLRNFIRDDLRNRVPILYINGDAHEWRYSPSYYDQQSFLRIMVRGKEAPLVKIVVQNGLTPEEVFAYDRRL